jgi:hypothetical protein
MERKYQVTSATSVMKMIVTFNKIEDGISEPTLIHVGVDYFNDRVFFEGDPIPGVDYQDLEQEILVHLRPPMIEQPKLNSEMMQRISDVKAGNYGADIKKYGVSQ